ncbi:MAG: hypothetical protein IPK79_09185 [Vampirovibrionales bacterium]|nr:hypothetical protein [Vampirovibrionales bacterium]
MPVSALAMTPLKAAQNEFWVDVTSPSDLSPGQLVRLDGPAPAYGQVTIVEALPVSSSAGGVRAGGVRLTIKMLAGLPSMNARTLTPLASVDVARAAQTLLAPITAPLSLAGGVVGDLDRLGTLGVLEGDSPASRRALLKAFALAVSVSNPQARPALIVDPCGLLAHETDFPRVAAGQDVRLSLQALGMSTFLAAMEAALPPAFRMEALHVLVKGMPLTLDFIPFQYLLSPKRYWDSPAKLPLLHALYGIHQNRVFADRPEEMFLLDALPPAPVTILDLSSLQEPWRGVFYRYVCQALLRQADISVFPILIEPEGLLEPSFLSAWLQQFEKMRGHGVAALSGHAPGGSYAVLPDSRLIALMRGAGEQQDVTICGRVSGNLPVTTILGAPQAMRPAESAQDDSASPPPTEAAHFAPFPEMPLTAGAIAEDDASVMLQSPAISEFETESDWLQPPVTSPAQGEASAAAETDADSETDAPAQERVVAPSLSSPALGAQTPAPDAIADAPSAHVWASESPIDLPPLDAFVDEPAPDILDEPLISLEPPAPAPAPAPALQGPPSETASPEKSLVSLSLEDLYPPPASALAATQSPVTAHHVSHSDHASDLDALFPATAEGAGASDGMEDWAFDFEPDFEPVAPTRVESLGESGLVAHGVSAAAAPVTPRAPKSPPQPPPSPMPAVGSAPAPEVSAPAVAAAPEPAPVYQNTQPEVLKAREKSGFQPGDRVTHAQYGAGVIEKIIPMEGRVTLKVMFDDVGKRLLDADTAKLTKA